MANSHVLVVDTSNHHLYELYQGAPEAANGGWSATSTAIFALDSIITVPTDGLPAMRQGCQFFRVSFDSTNAKQVRSIMLYDLLYHIRNKRGSSRRGMKQVPLPERPLHAHG